MAEHTDTDPLAFTPVPMQRRRRNGWTPERQALFIDSLAQCGSVTMAARSVRMSARSAYALLDKDGSMRCAARSCSGRSTAAGCRSRATAGWSAGASAISTGSPARSCQAARRMSTGSSRTAGADARASNSGGNRTGSATRRGAPKLKKMPGFCAKRRNSSPAWPNARASAAAQGSSRFDPNSFHHFSTYASKQLFCRRKQG
jgi:hypothetical protein